MMKALKATEEEMKMADNYFSILSNAYPEIWFDQGVELSSGSEAFTTGVDGDERNRKHIIRATEMLDSIINPTGPYEFMPYSIDPPIADPTPPHISRAPCRDNDCLFETNMQILPSDIQHRASDIRTMLDLEAQNLKVMGTTARDHYLKYPLSNAVDRRRDTAFCVLPGVTKGDYWLLDLLHERPLDKDTQLEYLVDPLALAAFRSSMTEVSSDGVHWEHVSLKGSCDEQWPVIMAEDTWRDPVQCRAELGHLEVGSFRYFRVTVLAAVGGPLCLYDIRMKAMPTKDFSVAIVGGGICGLLCAYALSKAGVQVEVFEAAAKFGEVGAGVGLGPNAVRALQKLGVLDAVLARSEHDTPVLRPFLSVSGYGSHEPIYDYPVTDEDRGLPIHRAAFLNAILDLINPAIAHVHKRCISIEPSTALGKPSTLHFADGTLYRAHLIIGADGIKSTVRSYVTGDPSDRLAFSKSFAYRGLIPNSKLVEAGVKIDLTRQPLSFMGLNKHIITFPIQGSRTINVVAFFTDPESSIEQRPHPWVEPSSQAELLQCFQGWDQPSRWAIHTVEPPLTSYSSQNMVLVGDSAHAMSPHLGAGVGQGIEDVLVLCKLLAHPQTRLHNLSSVLEAYDQVRRPRANMVLEASARTGRCYEAYTEDIPAEEAKEGLQGIWDPVWHHDIENDINDAFGTLIGRGIFQD
ncbi:hypothetical protein ONZ45_g16846 [Pleurotus djamor]|nr:hypothetical protein ONZ45_g16846 [Pleurotus djamor]